MMNVKNNQTWDMPSLVEYGYNNAISKHLMRNFNQLVNRGFEGHFGP